MKNKTELINGIRLDIQKEQDAISTYMGQVSKTTNMKVRKVLTSIANEERVHLGELNKLLEVLTDEEKYTEEGEQEVIKTLSLPEGREKKSCPCKRKVKKYKRETTLHTMR
jgi:rubrerythrin